MTDVLAHQDAPQFAAGAAYVEGDYVPIGEARIPILDWGFVRSDVTYDVVGVWQGAFFRLEDHLDRFFRSIEQLRMHCPYSRDEVARILANCVRLADLPDAYVEMIVTRGLPPQGSRDPRQCENRFYAFAIPYVWIASPEKQAEGLNLIVSRVPRIPPESVDPTVKNFHWGDMVRGLFEAFDRGGESVVLTDGSGNITEGPGFNLFCVVDGRLITAKAGVLEGVTRKTVIELAQSLNVKVEVGLLPETTLRSADEVFLSSTAGGIMPVTRLDGEAIGDGGPGPLSQRIRQLYWDAHADPKYAVPVSQLTD